MKKRIRRQVYDWIWIRCGDNNASVVVLKIIVCDRTISNMWFVELSNFVWVGETS